MAYTAYQPYQIVLATQGPELSYTQKLNTREWKDRREEIILRDNCTCQRCKRTAVRSGESFDFPMDEEKFELLQAEQQKEVRRSPLIDITGDGTMMVKNNPAHLVPWEPTEIHVHHKYYIQGYLPWQYDDGTLITVCKECHETIHRTETIRYYTDETLQQFEVLATCQRCGGDGHISQYNHVQQGICFGCGGNGYTNKIIS